jgi:hypothetical protein
MKQSQGTDCLTFFCLRYPIDFVDDDDDDDDDDDFYYKQHSLLLCTSLIDFTH